jgi:hypothetical protein
MIQKTEEILENVAWLIDALDDTGLEEVQDIPFLEIAKAVSITPLHSHTRSTSNVCQTTDS